MSDLASSNERKNCTGRKTSSLEGEQQNGPSRCMSLDLGRRKARASHHNPLSHKVLERSPTCSQKQQEAL